MKNKFKLGPLQELWLSQLEKYPERKMEGQLGEGSSRKYKACCLGELHLCAFRLKKKVLPFLNGQIIDCNREERSDSTLEVSYKQYGLNDEIGTIKGKGVYVKSIKAYVNDLSYANDNGVSWTEIAEFIRKYPEKVFTKSV